MNLEEIVSIVLQVVLYTIAIKSITGFHFPWEKCPCCGKNYRKHGRKNET